MMPPAPAFASITNARPRSDAMRSVTSRVTRSTAPPGGNGVTTWIGRSGYCAKDGAANAALSNTMSAATGAIHRSVLLPRIGRCRRDNEAGFGNQLRGLRAAAAGCSVAFTGLGSTVVVSEEYQFSFLTDTLIGTVCVV